MENPLTNIAETIRGDARDWALNKADAWLWGVAVGWDADELAELREQHGWTAEDMDRLAMQRGAFAYWQQEWEKREVPVL